MLNKAPTLGSPELAHVTWVGVSEWFEKYRLPAMLNARKVPCDFIKPDEVRNVAIIAENETGMWLSKRSRRGLSTSTVTMPRSRRTMPGRGSARF
jgi:hypothetical protein